MRVLLDACVLYPTVMREMLIGVAKAGLYQPQWSARILEEWARATVKIGPRAESIARGEIAVLRALWPNSEIPASKGLEARLWLPDPNDVHVLAAAIAGSSDVIVTMNAQDFPQNILQEEGLIRRDPDGFLLDMLARDPDAVVKVGGEVQSQAQILSEQEQPIRKLLKKARLPRLGKALENL